MKKRTPDIISLFLVLCILQSETVKVFADADKLMDFSFDGSGTSEDSARGASLKVTATLLDKNKSPTDLRTAAGLGVSGNASDKAFDNSAATDMGTGGDVAVASNIKQSGGVVSVDLTNTGDKLTGLQSFTVIGWFQCVPAGVIQNLARLVEITDSYLHNPPCFTICSTKGGGSLIMDMGIANTSFDENSVHSNYNTYISSGSSWQFFAITYVQAKDEKSLNVVFYKGSTDTTIQEAGKAHLIQPVPDLNKTLYIGNNRSLDRPFKGYIDNIRIYGSKTDDTGALSLEELTKIYNEDMPKK